MRKQHFKFILRKESPKKRHTFCLGKRFSGHIIVEILVPAGIVFIISTCKLFDQNFCSHVPMTLVLSLECSI